MLSSPFVSDLQERLPAALGPLVHEARLALSRLGSEAGR
jgi:hypothetical protein